ncbi:MAG: hypothetical protein WB930_00955 [Syntrophobacteraceae bacterium]
MISVHYFPKRDHIYCVANRKFIIILGPGCQTGAKLQLEDGLSLPKQCFFYHRKRGIFKTVVKEFHWLTVIPVNTGQIQGLIAQQADLSDNFGLDSPQ